MLTSARKTRKTLFRCKRHASCAACAAAAAAFLEGGCQPPSTWPPSGTPDGGAGGGEAAAAEAAAEAAMAPLFFELAAAWPVGYRLEEKCGALRAYVGDALEGMCTYHGCGRNEAAAL